MGKIVMLSKGRSADDANQHFLADRLLPVNYMGDFSIPGILVDRLPEAIRLLQDNHFEIVSRARCAEVVTSDLKHMRRLFHVLQDGGIEYGFADLVDRVYQG